MTDHEFIKVAKQLQSTDENEVVKVAGILNRLKNLFKQITNPQYRQAVENMKLEGGALSDAAQNLNKYLKNLTDALQDGDVHKYKRAKHALDNALQQFLNVKYNVDDRANKIWEYTLAEYKSPGFIDRFTKQYKEKHPEYDVELGKAYEGKTLRDFIAFRNVRDVHIRTGEGRNASKVLADFVTQSLQSLYPPKERGAFLEKYFSKEGLTNLLKEFSNAVLLGELIEVKPLKPSKDKPVPLGTTVLKVRTLPFKVPGVGATVQATVTLLDKRGDITKPANISLRQTDRVDFLEGPKPTGEAPSTLQEVAKGMGESPVEKEMEKELEKTLEEQQGEMLQERMERGLEVARQKDILQKVPTPPKPQKYEPPNFGELKVEKEEEKTPEELKETIGPPRPKKPSLASIYVDIVKNAEELPYQVTTLSELEFAEAMREGYKMAFGSDPTAEVLAGGWSQAVLESGRPIKLPNNNVGNIKATSSWVKSGSPYFVKRTGEYTPEGKYYVEEGTKWRAYPSPAAGAAGYWKLLGGRYQRAIDWMAAGDPTSASVALGLKGYYTAPIKGYSKAVSSIYDEFMKRIAPKMSGLKSAPAQNPGPKPPVKKWHNEYSAEERDAILKGGAGADVIPIGGAQKDAEPDVSDKEVDSLISKLVASPLTDMVKQAILKNSLPRSFSLVILSSNKSTAVEKLEFARVASSVLEKHLDIDARVCRCEDDIQINCSGIGSEMVMAGAIQEVCDMVSQEMKNKTGSRIYPTTVAGGMSKFDEVKSNTLIKNCKKFNMRRIANG